MPKHDFLVVGSSTVDVFARTRQIERIDFSGNGGNSTEHFVCINFGSKTDIDGLDIFPGGSAANSAFAMQRLGSETAVLACVGNDHFGGIALKDLESSGVDTGFVAVSKRLGTGVGINLASPSGEKSVLVYRGANDALGPEHLKEGMVKSARHVFVTSLVSQKNFALFLRLVKMAKKHHRPVIFAPSITMLHKWLPQLRKIHSGFAVSILNYEEGAHYSGKGNVREILRHLPGNVDVVSKDAAGAYAKEGADFFHVKALPVRIIDTAGAGDAFSGAFAHYYYRGSRHSVSNALSKAVIVAGLKLTRRGSRLSCSAREVAEFISRSKSKLAVEKI